MSVSLGDAVLTFVRLPLVMVSKLPVFIKPLFLRDFICFISYMEYMSMRGSFYAFLVKSGGGGVMNLVYGSFSSSYMDCEVIFVDECSIFAGLGFVSPVLLRRRLRRWPHHIRSYFYGSTTFRMSTRRLPVILFVSCFECPLYPVVCCAVCLWGPRR